MEEEVPGTWVSSREFGGLGEGVRVNRLTNSSMTFSRSKGPVELSDMFAVLGNALDGWYIGKVGNIADACDLLCEVRMLMFYLDNLKLETAE